MPCSLDSHAQSRESCYLTCRYTNGAFYVDMPRGCLTVMEKDGYAANGLKHCVRPVDMTGHFFAGVHQLQVQGTMFFGKSCSLASHKANIPWCWMPPSVISADLMCPNLPHFLMPPPPRLARDPSEESNTGNLLGHAKLHGNVVHEEIVHPPTPTPPSSPFLPTAHQPLYSPQRNEWVILRRQVCSPDHA